MESPTFGSLIIAGIMSLSNIGGLAYIGRRYAGRVDKHDEVLPKIVESLEANTKSVVDLYNKYNSLNSEFYQLKGSHDATMSNAYIHAKQTDSL